MGFFLQFRLNNNKDKDKDKDNSVTFIVILMNTFGGANKTEAQRTRRALVQARGGFGGANETEAQRNGRARLHEN